MLGTFRLEHQLPDCNYVYVYGDSILHSTFQTILTAVTTSMLRYIESLAKQRYRRFGVGPL